MKYLLVVLAIIAISGCGGDPVPAVPAAAPNVQQVPGIGVAIVVDHSGSMADAVPGLNNKPEQKVSIARNAVMSVIKRCETFAASNPNQTVKIAVYQFDDQVQQIVPFGLASVARAQAAVDAIQPANATAIGDAVLQAKLDLNVTGLLSQHIVLITDGENNHGHDPAEVATALKDKNVSVYVIAFDTASSNFDAVKKQGWNILSASDAAQLDVALDQVLGEHILIER